MAAGNRTLAAVRAELARCAWCSATPAGTCAQSANRAFLSLAELSAEDQARGQPLDRWLGRTGVELGVLITNLRQRGSVGRFVTALRGEYGTEIEVEISGSQLAHSDVGGETVLAFAIRDIERRLKPEAGNAAAR